MLALILWLGFVSELIGLLMLLLLELEWVTLDWIKHCFYKRDRNRRVWRVANEDVLRYNMPLAMALRYEANHMNYIEIQGNAEMLGK